jgi:hypothetical protein
MEPAASAHQSVPIVTVDGSICPHALRAAEPSGWLPALQACSALAEADCSGYISPTETGLHAPIAYSKQQHHMRHAVHAVHDRAHWGAVHKRPWPAWRS